MKKIKVYIITYKRSDVLNELIDNLKSSDFKDVANTQINVINNHTDFYLEERNKDVRVLHNMTRPDWSNGNLCENFNQAIIDGFRNLNNTDSEIVVTLQNDAVLDKNWCSNLLKLHDKYTFIAGEYGDNIVSYKADAIKKIGLWDERFCGIQHKEADYYLRALIFNREKSSINDTMHGRVFNRENIKLDINEGRNITEQKGKPLRKADNDEHQKIWNTSRSSELSQFLLKVFIDKWKNTWVTEPEKKGWIVDWTKQILDNPPKPPKKMDIKYPYFEKHIENKELKYNIF
jgi:hypothetical protein